MQYKRTNLLDELGNGLTGIVEIRINLERTTSIYNRGFTITNREMQCIRHLHNPRPRLECRKERVIDHWRQICILRHILCGFIGPLPLLHPDILVLIRLHEVLERPVKELCRVVLEDTRLEGITG